MLRNRKVIEGLKNENKSKALQITVLLKENKDLKYRLYKIANKIEKFDYVKDNPFTLINEIKEETKIDFMEGECTKDECSCNCK